MSVQKFSSLDEVADRANRTRYGLGASIFTKDVGKAQYLSHAIRAGTVWYVKYYVIFFWFDFFGYKTNVSVFFVITRFIENTLPLGSIVTTCSTLPRLSGASRRVDLAGNWASMGWKLTQRSNLSSQPSQRRSVRNNGSSPK